MSAPLRKETHLIRGASRLSACIRETNLVLTPTEKQHLRIITGYRLGMERARVVSNMNLSMFEFETHVLISLWLLKFEANIYSLINTPSKLQVRM